MLSHLAGTGRCLRKLRIAVLEVSRDGTSWRGAAVGAGIHSQSAMDGALAPAQVGAHCSVQAGRRQPQETLLQNDQFPTISYSRLPPPRKTYQQRSVIPPEVRESIGKDLILSCSKEATEVGKAEQGDVPLKAVMGSQTVLAGGASCDHFVKTEAQRRKRICPASHR